ncbi:serine/threonine-protein kinase [Sphaerisporangium album]|uniref:serine/threonine-protein kinase n=1 Tax=Sphaerisporangium album TaxID=509200 RepID=UPI0015F08933|nr:serine/threonine-protein kinase [Sphaerisporangium album]
MGPDDPPLVASYRVTGRIGEGGQGVVYAAETARGERVAVKLLHRRLSEDEGVRRAFGAELRRAQRVAGPHVARVLSYGIHDGRLYLASEYVDGPSLAGLVERQGPRGGGELDRLAVATLEALAAVHEASTAHGGFGPRAVLIGPDGPRVAEVGLGRALAAAPAPSPVASPFTAPENLAGTPLGPEADMFAWAGTMAYAATGRAPFGQDSVPAVVNRILTGVPDVSMLAGPLREAVAACLDKQPARRPTARALLDGLRDPRGVPPSTGVPAWGYTPVLPPPAPPAQAGPVPPVSPPPPPVPAVPPAPPAPAVPPPGPAAEAPGGTSGDVPVAGGRVVPPGRPVAPAGHPVPPGRPVPPPSRHALPPAAGPGPGARPVPARGRGRRRLLAVAAITAGGAALAAAIVVVSSPGGGDERAIPGSFAPPPTLLPQPTPSASEPPATDPTPVPSPEKTTPKPSPTPSPPPETTRPPAPKPVLEVSPTNYRVNSDFIFYVNIRLRAPKGTVRWRASITEGGVLSSTHGTIRAGRSATITAYGTPYCSTSRIRFTSNGGARTVTIAWGGTLC